MLRPYLVGKLGYTGFYTDLTINDPDDWDHCVPVDEEVLYEDGTILTAMGAGIKIDLASVFNKLQTGKFFIESNINFVHGGDVRYMNADADPQHHKPALDVGHVTADFRNTQTQIVHKHHVGHLYESTVQMTEIRVGFSMNISR